MNYSKRQQALTDQMKGKGFITLNPENIFYLTGFQGSFGMYLQTSEHKYLISDGRYSLQGKEQAQVSGVEFILFDKDFAKHPITKTKEDIITEDSLTISQLERLKKQFSKANITAQKSPVETIRESKETIEIDLIKKAQSHVDTVLFPFLKAHLKEEKTVEEQEKKPDISPIETKSENKPIVSTKTENSPKKELIKNNFVNNPDTSDETKTLNKKKSVEPKDTKKDLIPSKYNEDAFDLEVGLNSNFKIKIADLGNGCWTHYHFQPEIQTRQYRGPEVILGINYNETADLWSLACMLFEMLTGDFLFDPKKSKDFKKNDDHLAQMVELLNEFPKDWCTIGTNSKKYFTKDGKLKKIKSLQFWGLKDILMKRYKMDKKEAIALEDFLLPMLRIRPQDRASAEQMINHYWLDMPSKSFKNKNPIFKHQNDPERFEVIINSTDLFADVSDVDKEETSNQDDDEENVVKGKK